MLDADAFGNWLAPEAAPYGVLRDTLSARIIADNYLSALKTSLVGRATIVEGVTIAGVDFETRRLISPDGSLDIAGRDIVFSAGFETFGLIQSLIGLDLGHGVKGQAAVFEVASSDALPVIYDDGAYVVPQSATQCAVGSTSEDDWCDAMTTDLQDVQSIIERAQALCPPLRTGRLLKLWAGVRPRCVAKDPIVGCLDAARGLHIVTGGYKISFGIAHRLARRLVEELTGVEVLTDVPPRYTAAYHLSELQGLEGP